MTVRLYEGDKTETGGAGIEITDNKVVNLKLRDENNLIKINEDDEAYVDLQLDDGIEPDDDLPVGVETGRVLVADGRPVNGTLILAKTTSGDEIQLLYGDDGKIYADNGTGTFKTLGWTTAYFKTQDEYDALPASKTSDNNLYIIVDHHASFELVPWPELKELTPQPDEQTSELNTHPEEYLQYYLENEWTEDVYDGQDNFLYYDTSVFGGLYFMVKFDTNRQTEQEIRNICSGFHYPPTAEQINDAVAGLRIPVHDRD